MQNGFIFLLLFPAFVGFSQESNLDKAVLLLKERINAANKADKLKLTDSLITLVEFDETYDYSLLIQENIKLALEIDSVGLATKHAADFIYYNNHILGNPTKGLEIFNGFKGTERRSKDLMASANFYMYGSDCYFFLKDLTPALDHLQTAKEYAIRSESKNKLASALLRIGFVKIDMGLFAEASQSIQEARKYFVELKDTLNILGANNGLSVLYSQNKFYKEAQRIRDESIELSKQAKGNPNLFVLYYNTALDYREQGNDIKRIEYLKLLESEFERKPEYKLYEALVLSELAIAYAETDSLDLAEYYYLKLKTDKETLEKGNNNDLFIEASKQISFARGNYDDAIKFGLEHLEIKKNQDAFVEIYNAENFLAKVYRALGNKEKENEHLVSYFSIKDSISSIKNVQALTYYQAVFETEKRDLIIEAQKANIALLDEQNFVKNQWLLFGSIGSLFLFGFIWVLRSRNFAKRKQKLQEIFTQDILKTQENERTRIASELHDSVGQKLLMIKNALVLNEAGGRNKIDLIGETIKEVREMSHNLHPFQFEKLGLIASIKNMIETFQKNSNVFYSEDIEISDGLIEKEKEIYVFRMLQEALTNVEKHAEASACNLTAHESKNKVIFVLKDNGKGFKTDAQTMNKGIGMKTLKERATYIGAKLNIVSNLGKGTSLTLELPKK